MIISFFGHADVYEERDYLSHGLDILLEEKFGNTDDVVFYLGGYGGFNIVALECCKRFQQKHPQAKTCFITPYISKEQCLRNEYMFDNTDESIYPPLEKVPPRYAIVERNKWIVKQSDFIFLFVNNPASYSRNIFEWVVKCKKDYYNLGRYKVIV